MLKEHNEARIVATKLTPAVVEELHKTGFKEIVIVGKSMVNFLVEEPLEYVELARGFLRPLGIVAFVRGSDVVMFL